MEQGSLKSEIRELVVELVDYLETKFDIARLGAVETTAVVATVLLMSFIFLLLLLTVALFVSLAVAFYLGSLWQQPAWGFAAVAGFYLVLGAVLLLLRNVLFRQPILRSIIRSMLPDEPETKA